MIRNIPPDEVVPLVRKCFDEFPWSRGLRVVGIGRDAAIEVLTTDLVACEEVIALVGPRVAGYPLKARRYEAPPATLDPREPEAVPQAAPPNLDYIATLARTALRSLTSAYFDPTRCVRHMQDAASTIELIIAEATRP